jgi:hypothetical protein
MMSMSRLCKDCRWAALEENEPGMVWRCTHASSKFVPPPDYVAGKPVTPYQLRCYDARYFDDGYRCGPQGGIGKHDKPTHGTVGMDLGLRLRDALFQGGFAIIGISVPPGDQRGAMRIAPSSRTLSPLK